MATTCAGIVLAGGRSSRMGSPKEALDWHGSTLLRRVAGIVARAVDGPLIVVRARDQELPDPGPAAEVTEDAREGRGPLQGLAAGLDAVGTRAEIAYLSATDVPLLHPAFVRHVTDALDASTDVVLPVIRGHPQPLACAYRTSLLPLVHELLDAGRLRPAFLFARCRVLRLTERALGRDQRLTELDPDLQSVSNLNERADYERARALPPPAIDVTVAAEVLRLAALASPRGPLRVGAATLGAAAAAAGVALDERVVATLNGDRVSRDAHLPLVRGDRLVFLRSTDPSHRHRRAASSVDDMGSQLLPGG